jgi:crossover junction endodeoxyribonuclease RuvC
MSWKPWLGEAGFPMSDDAGRVILGLDPGTAATGFGVISALGGRLRAVEYGVIDTPAGLPDERRLEQIFVAIGEILARHKPSATAVESLFFNTNVRTALAVGQARGVTLLACSRAGCAVFEYTPQQIKRAVVGYGKASKEQVMEMVRVLLALREVPRPDHAADALGVAICHANSSVMQERIEQSERARSERSRRP